MIDDPAPADDGEHLPDCYWRLDGRFFLTARYGPICAIPELPLLAFGGEFSDGDLSVSGARYVDLGHITCWDATRSWERHAQRDAYDALQAAYPDTFSIVVSGDGPAAVWLVLRLTRLTDPITDTLINIHDNTCGIPQQQHLWPLEWHRPRQPHRPRLPATLAPKLIQRERRDA
ncbi:hypothetical protein ACFPIJ_56520 [Dactylosporangium cerinum]|uniref:Uncharacterized protein n=1 Tax=Dactylosporangium cerinum TaxID=1434730 RepID=A0ABV9WIP9_9ACTN